MNRLLSAFGDLVGSWQSYAAVAALAGALAAFSSWYVTDAAMGRTLATERAERASEAAAAARAALREIVRLQDELAGSDAQHWKDMSDAETTADALRDELRAGRLRFSIRTVPAADPAAAAGGVVDGGGRADIDPRDADALVAIAQRGDRAIHKLAACQAYAAAVSAPPP
jgi:hypothetical protein